MQAEIPSRPRLIDRLRFFHVYRRHFGDEDATEAVDALQEEFAQMATSNDIQELKLWLEAELNGIRVEINAAVLKLIAAGGIIAGIALAIARLT